MASPLLDWHDSGRDACLQLGIQDTDIDDTCTPNQAIQTTLENPGSPRSITESETSGPSSTSESGSSLVASVAAPPGPRVNKSFQKTESHLRWSNRTFIKVELRNLPAGTDTKAVWALVERYGGKIDFIHIVDDHAGMKAYVTFKPPPRVSFFYGPIYMEGNRRITTRLCNFDPIRDYKIGSLAKCYPGSLEIHAQGLDFGVLLTPSSMKSFHQSTTPIVFRLNVEKRQIQVEFTENFQAPAKDNLGTTVTRQRSYRFVVPLASNFKLWKTKTTEQSNGHIAIIISLNFPPEFSRKCADASSHEPGGLRWTANDVWFRNTQLPLDGSVASADPASLHNTKTSINLGSWTTYKLSFHKDVIDSATAADILDILQEFNFDINDTVEFHMVDEPVSSVFALLDSPNTEFSESTSYAEALSGYSKVSLPFNVRYQLEVCISEGLLCEYNLDLAFLRKLQAMDPERASGLLVAVAAKKERIFEPLTIFDNIRIKRQKLNLPDYCFYARSVIVTPTTMYVATPSLDVSNRVIRRFPEFVNRFLRVRFTEERPRGRLLSTTAGMMNEVYARIKRVLMNGVVIGDRHFQFLAFGNSQIREHGAYFFCSTQNTTTSDIRSWMGNPSDRVVAKYAARLGQCFSTTRAIKSVKPRLGRILDDKTTNEKYNFTDGCCIVSPFLASIVANDIKIITPDGSPPSALQFRLGGCKGVLATWPWDQGLASYDLCVRGSQEKFHAEFQGLEIIKWSQFSAGYLNRQFITILTTLGVDDEVFLGMMDKHLCDLSEAMHNPVTAAKLLQSDVDPNQMSLEIAAMVRNHFQAADEPFIMTVLQLWRAYNIKYLKEKARILVDDAAHLLGIIDESKTLQGHFNKNNTGMQKQRNIDSLPQIFVQVAKPGGPAGDSTYKIIEGVVLITRHPCLHPGDVRVVRAVDCPNLHHLKDVVVLPKTGDRDLASMCGGGDLDGDEFMVIWNKDLIPSEWNHEPMDFIPDPPQYAKNDVTIDDITSFFVQYIQNDSLGAIANAHLAHADWSVKGAKDDKCIQLAKLASTAVDYVKSGNPARMPAELRVKKWPHFFEKQMASYHSRTAVGQLYDRVQRVDFMPEYEKPFDTRLLNACHADEETLSKAALLKEEYDEGIRRIMAQHDIKTEFEIWSTFVLHHDNGGASNDYKFHEEIGRLTSSLKEAVRSKCYIQAGGREYEKLAPFVAAMYKVTHLQVQHAMERNSARPVRSSNMPFISFPWIFSSILGDIAIGRVVTSSDKIAQAIAVELDKKSVSLAETEPQAKQVGARDEVAVSEDVVTTTDGTIHKGEVLALFDDSKESDAKLQKIENLVDFGKVTKLTGASKIEDLDVEAEEGAVAQASDDSEHDNDPQADCPIITAEPTERRIQPKMSLLDQLARLSSR